MRWPGIGVAVALVTSACATGVPPPTPLTTIGQPLDGRMIVRAVDDDSPAAELLEVGDQIVAVGTHPVSTIADFFQAMGDPAAETITVEKSDGELITLEREAIQEPEHGLFYFSAVAPGEKFFIRRQSPYAPAQSSALTFLPGIFGLVSGVLWEGEPRFMELYVEIAAGDDCRPCRLDNIALMEWPTRTWLPPVGAPTVAARLYPVAGQPPPPVPIPPPTVVGYVETARTTGTVSAYQSGSTITGTYSGTTTSTATPIYDYTAQTMAAAHNLGVAIAQARIRADTEKRREFVLQRQGSLRLGDLYPGQQLSGYVFFVIPDWASGPFVVVMSDGETFDFVQVR